MKLLLPLLFSLSLAAPAATQQAMFTDAATQHSSGVFLVRTVGMYERFDDDNDLGLDRQIDDYTLRTTLFYGVTRDFALSLVQPVRERDGGANGESAFGFDDTMLMAKYRFYTNDFGPIDTARFSLIGGASVPTGVDAFTSDSVDPMFGGVFTLITGRHGFNADAIYRLNSGDDDEAYVRPGSGPFDALRLDANYLYRLYPSQFNAANSGGSYYAFTEANGVYETSGDTELMLAAGLMYEGSDVALEFGVRLPVYSDVDERPEERLGIGFGVRLLF